MTSVADYYLSKIRQELHKPKPKTSYHKTPQTNLHTLEGETWLPIANYTNYWISNYGRVYSTYQNPQGKLLTQHKLTRHGHKYARVSFADKRSNYVHLLVAHTFCIKNSPSDVVWHIDHNTLNNHADNLEWITRKESRQRRNNNYNK